MTINAKYMSFETWLQQWRDRYMAENLPISVKHYVINQSIKTSAYKYEIKKHNISSGFKCF